MSTYLVWFEESARTLVVLHITGLKERFDVKNTYVRTYVTYVRMTLPYVLVRWFVCFLLKGIQRASGVLNLFKTAVPFWGQTT